MGVSYAGGEYLIFCDADDWLLEEALEHCYNVAEKYDVDVVEFLIRNVYDHESFVALEKGRNNYLIELNAEEQRKGFLLDITEEMSLGSQKKMYRLSLIREKQIAFAEHKIFEEPSFVLPVRLYEKRHCFLDEALYICYLSEESTVRGDWGEHKWDNPKVWIYIIEEMAARELLQRYYEELEYLFFERGLSLSIRMAIQKGYVLTKEEFEILMEMTLKMFPNVRQNTYVREASDGSVWKKLILALLDLEYTDENAQMANEILRKYI